MDRGDVLSGAAFKAVLRSVLVFLAVMLATAIFSLRLIDHAMTEDLKLRVTEIEQSLLQDPQEDVGYFIARVEAVSHSAAGDTLAYALFTPDGNRLAGNIRARPPVGEWFETSASLESSLQPTAAGRSHRYLLHAVAVGDLTLVSGRSTGIIESAQAAARMGFVLSTLVVVAIMLTIGYHLSRRSQEKLRLIETTLQRVSEGEIQARIETESENAQIDRISRRINAHLNQLEELMHGTQRTAASIAHDLRRPLARATLSLGNALDQVEAGHDPRGEIEATLHELSRLASIISTILRIARIEGGTAGTLTEFDLQPLMAEIAETFAPVAEDAGQSLVYTGGDQALWVRGDAEMLGQLGVNLVQNAISHAGTGARVTLHAATSSDAVELVISDTGPGIAAELRERVFDPFFRTDTARTVEGSGLGLPLVKAITRYHGGTIQLEDAEPGLLVRVRIPACVPA